MDAGRVLEQFLGGMFQVVDVGGGANQTCDLLGTSSDGIKIACEVTIHTDPERTEIGRAHV